MRNMVFLFCLLLSTSNAFGQQTTTIPTTTETTARTTRCMNKVMMIEETLWEDRIKCHHSYGKRCFETYITTYSPETETECKNEYQKSCYIEFAKTPRNLDLRVCHIPLLRNCSLEGPTLCTDEHETVCETKVSELDVEDDVPDCQTVLEKQCDNDETNNGNETKVDSGEDENCVEIPKQVCTLSQQTRPKLSNPNTKCRIIRTRVCGPEPCPVTPAEPVCETVSRPVLEDTPQEKCDLEPQEICTEVTKLVPKLLPSKKCVQVPREICIKTRVNPKRVKRPVVRTWCTDDDDVGSQTAAPV